MADPLADILRQRTTNVELKKYALKKLDQLGSFDYTNTTLQRLNGEAMAEVETLGGNPLLSKLLEQLNKLWDPSGWRHEWRHHYNYFYIHFDH